MTNIELQSLLKQYPDDMPVKWLNHANTEISPFDEEKILHTSESAFVNKDAPEDEWDTEDGKIQLGSGSQYLLFNPIIV